MVRFLILIFSLASPIWATSKLISVVQVFRHGQRTPVSHYPNDPYDDLAYWGIGPGQLTNVGKSQHFKLGQYTRTRYNSSIPAAYTSDFIYAQTTDVDRTHMSGQCNLLGMFPPTSTELWNPDVAWSPIPLHPSDPNIIESYPQCAAFTTERNRVLANESYYQNIDASYEETYEYLTNYTGSTVSSLIDVNSAYDSLRIESLVGYSLPAWTDSVYPEPLTTLQGYLFQSVGYNTKLARLGAGPFLNEVMNHFETMKENSSNSQFYRMYSAHDYNIISILASFGALEPHVPSFAASIYMELWKALLGTYHVNIYYKQDDTIEKITPKGCLSFDCNFNNLKTHLSDILVDSDTWETECAA